MAALYKGGKSLITTVQKLCFATGVYLIWKERNRRFRENSLRQVAGVLWSITNLIRCRLSSVRGIQDTVDNRSIQAAWRLPDSIFS